MDGGKTWTHVWKQEGQIGTMVVHPANPNIAFAAVLGHAFGPNPERGVLRTRDGGKTWQFVLRKDPDTGASDVALDPSNPNIVFAGLWQARRRPWEMTSGGPGSGLWMSRDGGDTWTQLTGNGLPEGIWGKVGVAVAPSDGRRVYALIEAEKGGLYRSDDGGEKWTLASDHHSLRQRAWYYSTLTVDPSNPDVVWFPQVPLLRSIDGGRTIKSVKGPHHGDHHDLWIDPANPRRMIDANDGGVDLSHDGGEHWFAPPLPISQFYHVSVDNAVPYHVMGAMQDLGTAWGPSNSLNTNGIRLTDWHTAGGGEAGHVVAKPDDPNIVYAGTSVASGTGRAVVIATGMATQFGRIVHLTQQVTPEPTPLQRELAGLTRTVAVLATSIGVVFFVVGITVMKMPPVLGFLFGVGVIVALVPEGLLPTLTLSLALSVQRMARRNAIVKQLAAVDALGATTVICTDKTGTLTQGVMLVRELWTLDDSYEATGAGYNPAGTWRAVKGAPGLGETARLALICGALCNDARLLPPDPRAGRAGWQVVGDPTEGALLVAACKGGLDLEALQREQPRVGEHPFDARRKRMSTLHRWNGSLRIYVKGAPRETLALCTQVQTQDGLAPLSPAQQARIVEATDRLAATGLRVLALAYRDVYDEESIERLLSAESPPEEAERESDLPGPGRLA
ncbi:MAG: hypothetical protein C4289_14945 [Chloroflexota bacterium]